MGTDIESVLNDKEIFDYMYKYAHRVKDMKPLLRKLTRIILNDIDDNFETEGENIGKKWQKWSKSWLKKRQKLNKADGKIMSFNGDLRTSFTREVTSTDAIVGTDKEYAAIHNFGGDVKTRNGGKFVMPERKFAGWSDSLKAKILTEIVYELKLLDYKKYIN